MSHAVEYILVGAVIYALYRFSQAGRRKVLVLSNMHQTIPNQTEPPPLIRFPQQGWGFYGYFDELAHGDTSSWGDF